MRSATLGVEALTFRRMSLKSYRTIVKRWDIMGYERLNYQLLLFNKTCNCQDHFK